MLTALSVARDCQMIDRTDRVIHVTVLPPNESQGAHIEYIDNSVEKIDGVSTYSSITIQTVLTQIILYVSQMAFVHQTVVMSCIMDYHV
jgi:hypothetical protein